LISKTTNGYSSYSESHLEIASTVSTKPWSLNTVVSVAPVICTLLSISINVWKVIFGSNL
jgi:hypothetical protein